MDRMSGTTTDISIVVPFFNESGNIRAFFAQLVPVLERLGLTWEVVCVNDGSGDDTLELLTDQHRRNPRIKVLDLSRNFGKDAALSAGLAFASGRAVIPMDGDLQHPPEVIPELVAKWREGYEMVYGVRRNRDYQTFAGRAFSKTFYWLFEHFSDVQLPDGAGDFRLLDRKVVEALNRMPERNRFMKGMFAWVGFRQTGVKFDIKERNQGKSKWGSLNLIRFAVSGIAGFSNFPLRVWGLVGAGISLLAFAYIVFRLFRTAVYGVDIPGYESIIITTLFLGGMQLFTLGIIGDYLGRVFDEVKGRPLFIMREAMGIDMAGRPASHDDDDDRPTGRHPSFKVISGS
jgi:glycosyltransferase involved in cell wall biosynthesis